VTRKFAFILLLLVAVPMLALAALSWRLVNAEQARIQKQFEELLSAKLVEIDRDIGDYFDSLEDRFSDHSFDPMDTSATRSLVRSEPLIDQVIMLDEAGQILFPDFETLSEQESSYLTKVRQLLIDKAFVAQDDRSSAKLPNAVAQVQSQVNFRINVSNANASVDKENTDATNTNTWMQAEAIDPGQSAINSQEYGWFTWYGISGIELIHWQRLPDGSTVLVGVQRARWMADVITELPDSDESLVESAPLQIRLVDSKEEVVYLWGSESRPDNNAEPVAALHLSSPLRAWQLQHFGPVRPIGIGTAITKVNLLAAGGLLSLGLLGLAIYLGREITRQTREATERVNFVNQVSHELKTPLTNIRMYADLVAKDIERIDPDDERAQSHVDVITSESGRLSRLINNVLTFAGRNRDAKQRIQMGSVDGVIHAVLDQFGPSLEHLGFDVVLDLDASQQVMLDTDATEQMLGNLISNAEKYAASGKHLRIRSRYQNEVTTVDVTDAGPGVPPKFAKHVFQPFERASDHIHSATGTGIGLTITRSLAERHGGNLELMESAIGAKFRLTLRTPLWQPSS